MTEDRQRLVDRLMAAQLDRSWYDGSRRLSNMDVCGLIDAVDAALAALSAEAAPTPKRLFPIQDGPAIPWAVIAPWDRQAMTNHGDQNLKELARRGGLCVTEALWVLRGVRRNDRDPESRLLADRIGRQTHQEAIAELLSLVQERQAASPADGLDRETLLKEAADVMEGLLYRFIEPVLPGESEGFARSTRECHANLARWTIKALRDRQPAEATGEGE